MAADSHPGHASRVWRIAAVTAVTCMLSMPIIPALAFPSPALLPCMKAYMCVICGFVYEEEKGDPASGIPPGTRWDDVPLSWRCPDCGAGKEDFEMVEL